MNYAENLHSKVLTLHPETEISLQYGYKRIFR